MMTTLTLEIPDELNAALRAISARRHLPEAEIVRELLEREIYKEQPISNVADSWLENWRGQLRGKEQAKAGDDRLSHLLNKHLR
jgi:predicted transcriptional regulator